MSPERLNAAALDFGRGADSVAVVLHPSVNVDHRTRKGILLFLSASSFAGHTHFPDFSEMLLLRIAFDSCRTEMAWIKDHQHCQVLMTDDPNACMQCAPDQGQIR